jgi:hypothetical protein
MRVVVVSLMYFNNNINKIIGNNKLHGNYYCIHCYYRSSATVVFCSVISMERNTEVVRAHYQSIYVNAR